MAEKKKNVQMIVVDADGVIVTAANGHVGSDDREIVKTIKRHASLGTKVQLIAPFGSHVRASLDSDDLIGITAALFSARPGRTNLLEAPPEVLDWWSTELETWGGGCIPDVNPVTYEMPTLAEMERELANELFGNEELKNKGDN